eukprot:jgi/Ulvmu1/6422/UM003_0051.1
MLHKVVEHRGTIHGNASKTFTNRLEIRCSPRMFHSSDYQAYELQPSNSIGRFVRSCTLHALLQQLVAAAKCSLWHKLSDAPVTHPSACRPESLISAHGPSKRPNLIVR